MKVVVDRRKIRSVMVSVLRDGDEVDFCKDFILVKDGIDYYSVKLELLQKAFGINSIFIPKVDNVFYDNFGLISSSIDVVMFYNPKSEIFYFQLHIVPIPIVIYS